MVPERVIASREPGRDAFLYEQIESAPEDIGAWKPFPSRPPPVFVALSQHDP